MNKCGSCTLCCKLIGVKELNKPPNKWCDHCAPGKGCKIYDDRPSSCREFECGWLLSDLPEEYRPDNSHIILTGESYKELNAFIVHCDPAHPNAIYTPKVRRLFAKMLKHKSIIVVTDKRRKVFAASLEDARRVQGLVNTYGE